ncbi:MAG TPA: class II aldolase/adducin family protein [Syntrophomonadaceae bacterium]|nr:class II aldolase/adducin family protein [Syntrophomonadaceae bacterium]
MPSSDAEEILKIGHALLQEGLVVGTTGNVSVRSQDTGGIMITPSGVPYPDLQPEDLVLVDENGQRLEGRLRPSSEVMLHTAIYRRRQDVNGIIHTHSPFASVFAVNRKEIPPVLDEVAQLIGGSVQVAEYAPPGTPELADFAVSALRDRQAVLLANHGMVGVGRNLKEALVVCQVVEKAAQVYLLAKLTGNPYTFSEEEVKALRCSFLKSYGQITGRES